MNPEDLTPEELQIWNTPNLNEYHRTRSILACRAVKEMMKHPYTVEQAKAQIIRLFKSNMALMLEEDDIWNNTGLTEHQRIAQIKGLRAVKKRAEYASLRLRKIPPKPNSPRQ